MWDDSLVRWSFGMRPANDDNEERQPTHNQIQEHEDEKGRTAPDVVAAASVHNTLPSVSDENGRSDCTKISLPTNPSPSGTVAPETYDTIANIKTPLPLSSPLPSFPAGTTQTLANHHSSNAPMSSSPERFNVSSDASVSSQDRSVPSAMNETQVPTYSDLDAISETILEPVQFELERLSTIPRPDSYPKASGLIKVKPHAQVLKERLLPIGEYIVEYANGNGALELQLCRYVAEKHWPLPMDADTHLKIHALYHNALFLRDRRAVQPPSAPLPELPTPSSRTSSPPHEPSEDFQSDIENIPPWEPSASFRRELKKRITEVAESMTEKLAEKLAGKFNGLVHRSSPSKAKAEKKDDDADDEMDEVY